MTDCEDGLILAAAEHRAFCDSGVRYSLDEVSARYGLDLDALTIEVEQEEAS